MAGPYVHSNNLVETIAPLSARRVAAIAALGGWAAYCIAYCLTLLGLEPTVFASELPTSAIVLAGYLTAIRLVIYCSIHWPPISLWGRLRTGRWLLLGYDQVLVGPLVTLAIAALLPRLLLALRLPLPWAAAATAAAGLAALLGIGPRLREWHLTGAHRLVIARPKAKRRKASRD